jgi:hypothetical protein
VAYYASMDSMIVRRSRLLALVFMSTFLFIGCTKSQCENDVLRGLPSPDGADIAFVFRRSCGATTGWSTQVSVMNMHRSLKNEAGNVLVIGGDQSVHVTWLGPKRLLVTDFKEPIDYRNSSVDSVAIEFRPVPQH